MQRYVSILHCVSFCRDVAAELIRVLPIVRNRNMRKCDECTACCEGWLRAESLDMRPGKACKHKIAGGCAIYPDRPEEPCKTFRCGWLSEPDLLDEELRPDKCGAILLSDRPAAGYEVWRLVPVGQAVSQETLNRFRDLTRSIQMPIMWTERVDNFADSDESEKTLVSGSEEFISALKWDFSDRHVWDLSPPSSGG